MMEERRTAERSWWMRVVGSASVAGMIVLAPTGLQAQDTTATDLLLGGVRECGQLQKIANWAGIYHMGKAKPDSSAPAVKAQLNVMGQPSASKDSSAKPTVSAKPAGSSAKPAVPDSAAFGMQDKPLSGERWTSGGFNCTVK